MRVVALGACIALGASIVSGCRLNFDEMEPEEPCVPVVDVVAIASGRDFACALLADGGVRYWGAGESGQLGDSERTTRTTPVAPLGLGAATMVSAGIQHACAVVEGSVWCWGRNDAAQLGVGDRTSRAVPTRVGGQLTGTFVGVSAGGLHTCAWNANGDLYCWGQGNGTSAASSASPARVTGVPAITAAVTSSADALFSANHGCALGADGSAWCWGMNAWGQLGNGSSIASETPVRVDTSLAFVEIGVGYGHACGRTADGVVACWGLGADGQIGDGATENRFVPVVIDVPPSAQIAAFEETTCSRDRSGGVMCWGDNDREQLARGGGDALVPERIELPASRAISVGERHSCAIADDGVVRCWGSDRAGLRSGVLDPTAYTYASDAVQIAAGGDTTCARGSDGRVQCWGYNGAGQVGDGTRTSRAMPVDIGLANVTDISVGPDHACARRSDASVVCWGSNDSQRVAFGGAADYVSPTSVSGIGISPTSVAAGGGHTCAVGANGVPWCWGNADEGTLGGPTPIEGVSAPVASDFANVASVTAGANHTCVVTTSDQVWCSGRHNEGQIGRPDSVGDAYQPLEVTGAPSATKVAAGRNHTCAINTAGGGWCWGDNQTGQIGDGTDTLAPAPVALSLTGLVEIAAGDGHTCARDAANTVWCWGANTSEQLGDQTFTTRWVPTVSTVFSGARQLALGTSHTCALLPDGTVRCAGTRLYGQTTLPATATVPSPAPVAVGLTCPR